VLTGPPEEPRGHRRNAVDLVEDLVAAAGQFDKDHAPTRARRRRRRWLALIYVASGGPMR